VLDVFPVDTLMELVAIDGMLDAVEEWETAC
jgi:hypothetical protein